jgi:membrane associated rhomboid family serine protease
MDWRVDDFFPKSNGFWQFWRPPFGKMRSGELQVKKAILQWHPWDPILITTPSSEYFMPPICVSEVAGNVHKRMLLQYKFLIFVAISLSVLAVVSYLYTKSALFERMAISGAMILAFIVTQYLLIFRDIDKLCKISRFVSWVYLQKTSAALIAILLMVVIGIFQYIMERKLGGFEPLILKYGLVFEKARDQPWRYLVGPFFHSGIAHWAGNAVLLVMAAGLSAALAKRYAMTVIFLLGVVLPPLALGFLPADFRMEAFGGVSGGIFALLGWVGGFALRNKNGFPPYFGWVVITFAMMFVGLSWLMNPQAGNLVHALGFTLGMGMGMANFGSKVREVVS